MGSALMGSISGSPVANVVATGAFTIPLMKKAGYPPETSGAVESCASTGSMFTPPVMGAAAFFMVEFTGIPYIDIVKIAAIPAAIYYVSIATMVWLEARKGNLKEQVSREEIPRVGDVVRKGWFLVIPLVMLLYLLMDGRSPSFAAFWSALACIVFSWFTKEFKMKVRDILNTFAGAGKNVIMIASITGVIGILVGVLNLTGLGLKLSQIILALSGGNLLLTIFLVCVAAFILGMGSPIAAVYVILAVIAPAAMVELGVPVIAAHLLLIWYSQLSGLTPPVCLVAFAAASISGGDPFKTGILSMKLGFALLLLPLLFIYTPLLLTGTALESAMAIVTSLIAVFVSCLFVQRYFLRKTSLFEQLLLGIGGLLLYTTYLSWNIVGLAVVAVPMLIQVLANRKVPLKEGTAQAQ
jgi:TRAP transporter 4TM/12TM fusion protein